MTSETAIEVEGLRKSFGKVHALAGVDLSVPRGSVLGVLGPNGAGKTTAVKILTTLLQPDSGRVVVEGHDVVTAPAAVREVIGLAGQSAAIMEELSGRENLEFIGRLFHLGNAGAKARAADLLDRFSLADAADRRVKTYSGGMARRLDLAASLVAKPRVLFLDEPTTGLDPRGRTEMWQVIRELVASGTTLLLTTQYLDEADELADNIVVFDRGTVIAEGTANQLKDRIGGDVVEFQVETPTAQTKAMRALKGVVAEVPTVSEDRTISVRAGDDGSGVLVEVVRRLDAAKVSPTNLGVRRPSLDDVFLSLTGHVAEETPAAGATASPSSGGSRRRLRRARADQGADAA